MVDSLFYYWQMSSSDPISANQGILRRIETTVTVAQEAIQNLDGSDLKGTNKFVDNSFKNSTGATITLPSTAGTLALTSEVESAAMTLTNKTLTAPVISSISNAGATITVPTVAGTLALLADLTTSTLTLANKTLTSPEIATITNGAATLTLPTTTGTIALMSDVEGADETIHSNINTLQQEINYLAVRLEATLQYLKKWINAGNLAMADIVTKVDAAVDAVSQTP